MDNLETINQDRTCDKHSEERDGTVDHPYCQILDVDSIYECNPSSTNSFDVDPSTKEEIMATGYPSRENIFVGHGFVGSFYPNYGVANWVFECLTLDQINANLNFKEKYPSGQFYEDRYIDFERIVTLMDYRGSGYVRGHLAAAANHKYNSSAYYSTFWIGNTAPMHNGVNRYLEKIEKYLRNVAKDYERSYILTGSVFSKREIKFMKDSCLVRVPDAYYKVVIFEDEDSVYKVESFLIDNEPDNSENIKKGYQDIQNARVTLAIIKELTGLNILSVMNGREICEVPLPKRDSRCISEVPLPNERISRQMFDDLFPDQRTYRGIGS